VTEVDTRDMLAVHRAFRREFADLGDLVAAVPDGDVARASIVGAHVLAMTTMLHSHHASEDEVLWPIMHERAPERSALAAAMEGQHELIDGLISNARSATQRWMMTGAASGASQVCWCMEQMSATVDRHLAQEETDVLPVAAHLFTPKEWSAVGEHARAGLTSEQLDITLGVIADSASEEEWALIMTDLEPAVREHWEAAGRTSFVVYRARLVGTD
jgi:hemerythrin-like domain-containing protein